MNNLLPSVYLRIAAFPAVSPAIRRQPSLGFKYAAVTVAGQVPWRGASRLETGLAV